MDSLNSNLEFFSMIIFIIFIFFYHSYSCFIFTMSFQYFTAIIIIQVYYIDGEVIVGISKKLCMWSVENIL